jgi:uncharacterized protein YtpQ (UPF0354 family)
MKVVCIDDHTLSGKKIFGLTVGKIYDAIDESKTEYKTLDSNTIRINKASTYKIIDDNGQPDWYSEDVLIPLEKYRELKLKDLLDN